MMAVNTYVLTVFSPVIRLTMSPKSEQIQIRVSANQKAAIRRLAQGAGQDVSSYVLQRVLPDARLKFDEIIRGLGEESTSRFALAELNDLLTEMPGAQLIDVLAVASPELAELPPLLQNYVAAMVEQAAHIRNVAPPAWTEKVAPLDEPYFAGSLRSLRLYLLRAAPVPFKRRNVFVDSGIGARV